MGILLQDIAFAWRNACKNPGTSLLIVFTLALGIGANTAIFNMTWHVLLAPLPYADGDRLVRLEQHEPDNGFENMPWSNPTLEDLREQNRVFSHVLQYFQTEYTLYRDSDPFLAYAAAVDGDFFTTMGLEPALGRLFTADDDRAGAAPVILLSNRFWREAFQADPDVLGSTVEMYDIVYTVVGVVAEMPPYPRANDVWVTAANDWVMSNEQFVDARFARGLVSHVIGKLDEDVSLEQAQRNIDVFAGRLRERFPDIYREATGYTITLKPLKTDIAGSSTTTMGLLLSLAVIVVMIAGANIANITLARMTRRSQELALREAVGADPGRIKRQLFTENILIATVGGLAGLGVATLGQGFITGFAAEYTPLATEIGLDSWVLGFCMLVTLAVGTVSGLVVGFQTRDINQALKEGGDKVTSSLGTKKYKDALLVVQCALAFVMLSATAVVALSLYRLASQPTGFDTEGVFVLSTIMRGTDVSTIWQERDLIMQAMEETRALPGVVAAGHSGLPVLQGPGFPAQPVTVEGAAADGSSLSVLEPATIVSEGFFQAMDVPLLSGRTFAATDDENAPPVVLVNRTFADRYFPAGNAVGQRVSLFQENWQTIIGVVGDIRARGIDRPETGMIYTNYRASPTQIINLYVKTTGDLQATADAVSGIIQRLDPLQPIDSVTPLNEVRNQWLAPVRLRTGVIAAFGLLALVVTLSGVIGVVSYNVNQRTREIGVRMAVGADPGRIQAMFVRHSMKIAGLGLLLGGIVLRFLLPALSPLLYRISLADPGVYLSAAALLGLTVFVGSYLPGRKAARLNPTTALHAE